MGKVVVLDAEGKQVSFTSEKKAQKLLAGGKAVEVSRDPFTIRLARVVDLPVREESPPPSPPGVGKRILLHICCGPCGTYTIRRLRDLGFAVTGYWYNPNIHPFAEHELRRETLRRYAEQVSLPVIWHDAYDMPLYFRQVAGHEAFRERCRICYRMRLEQTARAAREGGFDAFTTTLLISIHQDQDAIRQIGEEVGAALGVPFFYEDFRRGWSERGRVANEYGLYKQQYCGCLYSEWEAARARAARSTR